MKTSTLLFLIFFIFSNIQILKAQEPAFLTDSLDNYINRALQDWKIPGIAVAIVKDGKVVTAKGYGISNLENQHKVDANTLFMIGSNTKAFTGTLLSWLAYDNKCTLDDQVNHWLPDFKMKDPWVGNHLNLTDILCHRMGMETFQGDFIYWTSNLTRQEVVKKYGEQTPLYGFRTRWGYTNAGFLIAGQCIQRISGMSWENNLKNRILEPLDMTRTVALAADFPNQINIASPYTLTFDTLKVLPFPMIDNLAPAGSIGSSVNDMSHWLICQLDSGRYMGKSVIPYQVIRETRSPRSIQGDQHPIFNNGHFSLYGLGWELQEYDGKEVVSHTGGVNGFVTSVTMIPEEKLGIVVLTNTDQNYFYEALKWEIMDAYLRLPYRNYSGLYLQYFKHNQKEELSQYKSWKDSVSMHPALPMDLQKFTGRYTHPVYGFLDITQAGNRLMVSFEHHPLIKASLEYMGKNRFLCTYNDPVFGIKAWDFDIANQQVSSLTLRVADFLEFTTYKFVKDPPKKP